MRRAGSSSRTSTRSPGRTASPSIPTGPPPTFYDELNAGLQELVNGTKSPADVQQQLGEQYQAGVDDIVG